MIEQDGVPDSILRVMLGNVTSGRTVQVTIDDNAPISGAAQCTSGLCLADFSVTESFVAGMKIGQSMVIVVPNKPRDVGARAWNAHPSER